MLSRQKTYEVLEFVDEHLDRLPDLTPRTLETGARCRTRGRGTGVMCDMKKANTMCSPLLGRQLV
jgi:hypothetical protein